MREWYDFVGSLNREDFRRLAVAVQHEQDRLAQSEAREITLNPEEMRLIRDGKRARAILSIKRRTKVPLLVAKAAVRIYRDACSKSPLPDPSISPSAI